MRITTGMSLRTYTAGLAKATMNQYSAMNTVLTQRNFNSFAEAPAQATESYRLRSSYAKNESQQATSETMIAKFETAHSSLQQVSDLYNNALEQAMEAENAASGGALVELGKTLINNAESMVRNLNTQYNDKYIFAGANGDEAPFELTEDGILTFRGHNVDWLDPNVTDAEIDAMTDLTVDEKNAYKAAVAAAKEFQDENLYVDLGLGFQLNEQEQVIPSTAFDSCISGLEVMGYGVDENGDPNNMVSIIYRLGKIYTQGNDDGTLPTEPEDLAAEADRLFGKMQDTFGEFNTKWADITSRAEFLDNNHERLESVGYNLNEQIGAIDDVDPAMALTTFAYAQYAYNAALRVGNEVLSQSFIDYMS